MDDLKLVGLTNATPDLQYTSVITVAESNVLGGMNSDKSLSSSVVGEALGRHLCP